MSEPLFIKNPSVLTVGEIATLTGAEPCPDARLDRRITNIAALDRAGPSDLTFIENSKYADQLARTRAGACLTAPRFEDRAPRHLAVLRAREPYRAFVMVARTLFPAALRPSSLFEASGVLAGAFVHPSAQLESGVTVDPGAVIGPGAKIGSGTVIGPTAVIGPEVRIGRDCAIGIGASITHALIGDRVIVHPGCRIGQDGFGFLPGDKGALKVPQLRRVIIQDDVEIGANSTIDRGGLRDTVIGAGTKIDNLVQIGHNVSIGRHCFIVSQTGVSGSTDVEDYVMMGGQVGIADHLTIGTGAQLAARAGVISNVPAGGRWGGYPAMSFRAFLKRNAILGRLTREGKLGRRKPRDDDERGDE